MIAGPLRKQTTNMFMEEVILELDLKGQIKLKCLAVVKDLKWGILTEDRWERDRLSLT